MGVLQQAEHLPTPRPSRPQVTPALHIYGTAGVLVGQRVLGLPDSTRDGTLAECVTVEARNLAPLPGVRRRSTLARRSSSTSADFGGAPLPVVRAARVPVTVALHAT
jgi:NADPH:quinone reductase-like Zn-dependent oxidoreductase